MLGSNGERMLAAALPHVDAWNTWFSSYGNSASGFAALNSRIDAACERAGRDPATLHRSLMTPLVVGEDEAGLRRSAERVGARFGRDAETVLERYGALGPVGTIDQVVVRLKEIEEIGYERVMLQHLPHDDLETVALIGRELAPAVA